ncbi:MAG: class I SAM-dependent methyltransferase [Candidatus Omnitrophica bacterium]|nr:class I SAM-dependent methyltransferase [Candidatus Omnitrophota bacterium]MCM8830735.1 class I SAM-dependent methyltransferase [Candidatus Omnitrophota bacterium]
MEIDCEEKVKLIKERFGSNIVYQEHLSRYYFAKEFVKDKFILDAGCNIGDGTFILASTAKKVIAFDIDRTAINYANKYFKTENIDYFVKDVLNLDFKNKTFDVVVSLEVVEHLLEQDRYLYQLHRVLKDDGLMIISTPNKKIIKIEGSSSNPTHIKELDYPEFKKLLKKYFKKIDFYGQKRGKGIVGYANYIHKIIRAIDFFKLRTLFSQNYRNKISDKLAKYTGAKGPESISLEDIKISKFSIGSARTIIAVCKK